MQNAVIKTDKCLIKG